jgi:serine phosphatase RsbU (regulator of sigma subunit)
LVKYSFLIIYAMAITTDAQAIQQYRQDLEKYAHLLLNLSRNQDVREGNVNSVFERVTKVLSETLNVSMVGVWAISDDGTYLTSQKVYHKKTDSYTKDVVIYKKDFPSYFAALEKETFIKADNAHTNPNTSELTEVYLKPNEIYSLLDVPYFLENRLGGVICFEHQGYFREWTFEEIMLVTSACAVIAIAFQASAFKKSELKATDITKQLIVQNVELQQQKEEITAQREAIEAKSKELELKNSQIKSSINAALHIQEVILPTTTQLDVYTQENFVLYRPKDIVSGDFYWISPTQDGVFLAVADCTGHGVQGAFMTLIGKVLLDKIVEKNSKISPAKLIHELHLEVNNILQQETMQKFSYGMDIAIVHLTPNHNDTTINFAGAKRPLWYIQNGESEIRVIKGSKKSVGSRVSTDTDFEETTITLPHGSLLYLSSDGYYDQNDQNRNSLGKRAFKDKLERSCNKNLTEQKNILETELDTFSKNTAQRDDILVIGLKL